MSDVFFGTNPETPAIVVSAPIDHKAMFARLEAAATKSIQAEGKQKASARERLEGYREQGECLNALQADPPPDKTFETIIEEHCKRTGVGVRQGWNYMALAKGWTPACGGVTSLTRALEVIKKSKPGAAAQPDEDVLLDQEKKLIADRAKKVRDDISDDEAVRLLRSLGMSIKSIKARAAVIEREEKQAKKKNEHEELEKTKAENEKLKKQLAQIMKKKK